MRGHAIARAAVGDHGFLDAEPPCDREREAGRVRATER